MPWQRDAADVGLEIDPTTGLYYYRTVVVTVPRQAGKTKLIGDVADHRCLTLPGARVWITQQSGKDAAAWMRDEHFAELTKATFLAPHWAKSLRAGDVGVTWPRLGSTFRAFPPTRDALHGKQGDLIFPDEAWAHDSETGAALRQSIRATMATRRGAQLWIVSTKGDARSHYLQGYLDLAQDSLGHAESRVCFIDYGIPDDADAEDLDVIAEHHPAYGHTITRESLEAAREDFRNAVAPDGSKFDDVAGWARAYGNRPTDARKHAFPPADWDACGVATPDPVPNRPGIAFDLTPDGSRVAIGAGWRDPAGIPSVELIAPPGPVTRELPDLLAAIARALQVPLLYGSSSLATLDVADAIARAHPTVQLITVDQRGYGAACVALRRAITTRTLRHPQQPALTAASRIVTARPSGDGGIVWGRGASPGSIAEIVAVTLALRGFDALPKPRGRARILTAT